MPAGLTINGNLTVDAPLATVNNYATVSGSVVINNVSSNTWNEYATTNRLVFNATGKTLNIKNTVGALIINVNSNLITSRQIVATVKSGATVVVRPSVGGPTITVVGTGTPSSITPPVEPNKSQAAPTGLVGVAVTSAGNDGKIINVTNAMEYRLKGETNFTAITGTEVTGLVAGTYEVRFAAKTGYNAGATAEVVVAAYVAPNQDQAAPTGLAGVAVTVAGNDGKITGVTDAMEYRLKGETNFTAVTGTEITELVAGTYEVRFAAKTGYNAGEVAEVVVAAYLAPNQDQAAPTGLAGVAVTVAGNDGKITGVTDAMEYRLKGETNFTAITGTEVTELVAGTYEVRFAAKTGYNAGEVAEVVVAAYVVPTTYVVTVGGDAVETTDYTISGSADLTKVEAGTELTITAVTDITVNGEKVATKAKKVIIVNDSITITINKYVEEVLEPALGAARSHDYGTATNWMDLSKLSISNAVVTADFTNGDVAAIQSIHAKLLKDKKIDANGNVAGTGGDKEAWAYAIDSYVMNTFSRYLGALGRLQDTPVQKIIFDDYEYTWDGSLAGSNWKNVTTSLVAAVVTQQKTSIRNVTFTLVDANNRTLEVNFKATNVPEKKDVITVEGLLNLAKEYKYGDYNYTGTSVVNGTTINYSAPGTAFAVQEGDANTRATMDLARILGAIYRVNIGITGIEYDSETYSWNESSTLEGSKWENNGETLVSKIVSYIETNQTSLPTGVSFNLNISGEVVTFVVKATI